MVSSEGPDGTTAWIVAFAAFVINFIMAGIFRISGILFVAVMDRYNVNRKSTSMPFAMKSSVRNFSGLAVGILGAKYGAAPVTIAGGILGVISSAACFYAKDITGLVITWGIINGISSALITVLPTVVIGQYFEKYRTTATGISYSGGSIASFILPILIEKSLDAYGLDGTFLIIGAMTMHTIPAAMFLKKPPWLKDQVAVNVKNLTESCGIGTISSETATDTSANLKCLEALDVKDAKRFLNKYLNVNYRELRKCLMRDVNFLYLIENENLLRQLLSLSFSRKTDKNLNNERASKAIILSEFRKVSLIEDLMVFIRNYGSEVYDDVAISLRMSKEKNHCKVATLKQSVFSINLWHKKSYNMQEKTDSHLNARSCAVNEIFYHNSRHTENIIDLLETFHKNFDIETASNNTFADKTTIHKVSEELNKLYEAYMTYIETQATNTRTFIHINESKKDENDDSNKSYFYLIKAAMKQFTNPIYLLICLSRMMYLITFPSVVTTIVDYSIDKGLKEDGKFLIAAIASGDLLGRMCTGWITDRGFLQMHKYIMVGMIALGFSTFSLSFFTARFSFLAAVGIFSLLQGSLFVRHPVLITKYMDRGEHAVAMGSIDFSSCFVGLLLPLYIGFFRDTMGSYSYIMYINGTMVASVGLLWIMEPYLSKKGSIGRTQEKI